KFLALLRSARNRPVLVAHRGDSYHAPENTLESARLGHEAGADAWELDVQLTQDAVPVVLHDESLVRTTDVAARFPTGDRRTKGAARSDYPVSRFTLDELRTLDAGSWFVDPRGLPRSAKHFGTLASLDASALKRYRSGTVLIPTLEEALSLTKERDWLV